MKLQNYKLTQRQLSTTKLTIPYRWLRHSAANSHFSTIHQLTPINTKGLSITRRHDAGTVLHTQTPGQSRSGAWSLKLITSAYNYNCDENRSPTELTHNVFLSGLCISKSYPGLRIGELLLAVHLDWQLMGQLRQTSQTDLGRQRRWGDLTNYLWHETVSLSTAARSPLPAIL